MTPEPRRMAIHQAGHAVVQTLVGRRRFSVARVSIDVEPERISQGLPPRDEASLDREVFLGLYEYGLVTLAGIAAEERWLKQQGTVEDDPIVALSDLAAWQEQAWDTLQDEARVQLVGLNVMRKLRELFDNTALWPVVERLAEALVAEGMLEGDPLRAILEPLEDFRGN